MTFKLHLTTLDILGIHKVALGKEFPTGNVSVPSLQSPAISILCCGELLWPRLDFIAHLNLFAKSGSM